MPRSWWFGWYVVLRSNPLVSVVTRASLGVELGALVVFDEGKNFLIFAAN